MVTADTSAEISGSSTKTSVDSRSTVDWHVGHMSVEGRSSNNQCIGRCIGRSTKKDSWSMIKSLPGVRNFSYIWPHIFAWGSEFDSNFFWKMSNPCHNCPASSPPPAWHWLGAYLLILANLFLILIFQLLLLIVIPCLKKIKIFLSFLGLCKIRYTWTTDPGCPQVLWKGTLSVFVLNNVSRRLRLSNEAVLAVICWIWTCLEVKTVKTNDKSDVSEKSWHHYQGKIISDDAKLLIHFPW